MDHWRLWCKQSCNAPPNELLGWKGTLLLITQAGCFKVTQEKRQYLIIGQGECQRNEENSSFKNESHKNGPQEIQREVNRSETLWTSLLSKMLWNSGACELHLPSPSPSMLELDDILVYS